ncbi:MAG: hypothetical protein K5905_10250 [Roseibium sp.]|uniref:DUF6732 family protein n=1 Tax=Roseibium sp. TaxID=1936156 RepID=UPI00260C4A71|nr:DUF6732 family protein [Roseibium sp.]MCV0425845.1 hypothetical protein [Roseibium sp.]
MIHRTLLAGLSAALLPTSAFAHGGHLGELAGHSHWVGVAALAGAALVAGLVALKGRKTKETDETQDVQGEEDEASGEAAQ